MNTSEQFENLNYLTLRLVNAQYAYEQGQLLRNILVISRDAAKKEKRFADADNFNAKAREVVEQLNELERNIGNVQREQRDVHAKVLSKGVKVVSMSSKTRGDKSVSIQVVVKVGGTSYTRHLRLQANGTYTGRGIGAAQHTDTFYTYEPFAVYRNEELAEAA